MRDEKIAEKLRKEFVEKSRLQGRYAKAFQKVPRHRFVPDYFSLEEIYSNKALVIKNEDGVRITTSSEPLLMEDMLKLLSLRHGNKVLEIGTGTGYNAALLAELTGSDENIYTVEIDEAAVQKARKNLEETQYSNVHVITGDGSKGYAAGSPYDRIIVTASTTDFFKEWLEQLGENGILVAPFSFFGSLMHRHRLVRLRHRPGQVIGKIPKGWVSFSPMVGEHQELFNDKQAPKALTELMQFLKKAQIGPWPETADSLDIFIFCKICESIQSNLFEEDLFRNDESLIRSWLGDVIKEWLDDAVSPMVSEYDIEVFTNEEPISKSEHQFVLERHFCKIVVSY